MRAVVTIDDDDPEVVAIETRSMLEMVASVNRWHMRKRRHRIPPLYESGIRFRLEPWAEEVQWFANCLEVLEQGWGDCKMLCAWRIAELRERYPSLDFAFHITRGELSAASTDSLHAAFGGRARRIKVDLFHVQIALPEGYPELFPERIEDISRFLHQ